MALRSLSNNKIENKRVVLRVDFNVALQDGKVLEDFKIKGALPTIKHLLKNNCQIVLLSHLGRPEGKRVSALSLKPVCLYLSKLLPSVKIKFFNDKISLALIKKLKNYQGQIAFLENIRFEKGEDFNDLILAKKLSQMGEIFVNEAFAACHRALSSTVGITKYLPSYAGLNLSREIKFLSKALRPNKPAIAVIGGAKVETKAKVIRRLARSYAKILLGGGLANTFLAAKGYELGASIGLDKADVNFAKKLLKLTNKIVLPLDVVVADKKTQRKIKIVMIGKDKLLAGKDEQVLDIGPATVNYYSQFIRTAQTIVWNGPMGLLEKAQFRHGSVTLAKIIASRASGRALGIAGGGETLYAIDLSKMGKYFDFVSTGGGAMLTYLEGTSLAGLKPLIK